MRVTQNSIESVTQSFYASVSLFFFFFFASPASVFVTVCIQFADRQVGIYPNRGAGSRSRKVSGIGVDEGCSAELQRRIIVGSCYVSCDSGEAKTAAVYPPSPPSPSPSLLPSPSLPLCLHPPMQHQRESVAQAQLSWPVGCSCCT